MSCPDLCPFVIFKYVRKKAKKVSRLSCFNCVIYSSVILYKFVHYLLNCTLILFRMGFFGAAYGWLGGGGSKKAPPP